jgi:hypothetical protein
MNQVRDLIKSRIKELKTNMSAVSKIIGQNHAYLQQFLSRGVPHKLPEDVRKALANALNLSEIDLRGTPLFKSQLDNLASPSPKLVEHSGKFVPQETVLRTGDSEMPLYRFVQGGKGKPILDQIPFESAPRPDYLERVRDPYGVMVEGLSMIPEYEPGWIAQVNPNITARPGDSCIFRGVTADGSYWAVIKRLVRETDTHWHVEQHNPPEGERKQFTLKKSDYQVAHVTVGSDKRRR